MTTKPANDNDVQSITRHVRAMTISSANCLALTGMSWTWVLRFAAAHEVPIWRVGERKRLVPARAFEDAMQRVATESPPISEADELARIRAEVTAKFARR